MPAIKFDTRTVLIVIAVYGLVAYLLLPTLWRRHERLPNLSERPLITRTGADIPGDPMNVGMIGSKEDLIHAFAAAGWQPADSITLRSSIAIGISVVLRRPDPDAPVSSLYYEHRKQDLAFEREVGKSADQRHHVRFWQLADKDETGRDIWLGAATFDRGVGFSHDTGQITHHIDGDLDVERAFLIGTLEEAKRLADQFFVAGIGPTVNGRNGGGDRYFTDGRIAFGVLTADATSSGLNPPKSPAP